MHPLTWLRRRPRLRPHAGWAAALWLTVAACSGSSTPGTPAGSHDAGPTDVWTLPDTDPVTDTGTAMDTVTAVDTGGVTDSGTAVDTGTATDAGTATDTATAVDAGTDTGADAGTLTDAGPCPGGCATGFTCGAGGICRSSTGVPAFGNVYLVVMENTSQSSLRGSTHAPYINELLRTVSVAGTYQSVAHPSLPNYIALTSGDTQGITCDCQPGTAARTCNFTCLVLPDCNCNQAATHLGDQFDGAAITWREYGQSMGTPCNTASTGPYAARHLPFLYYDNVRTNPTRCQAHVRDYGDFAADRGHYRFAMISPDLCHDMHDSCTPTNDPIRQGDDWLAANVPLITGSPGFDRDGVLFIVWDEGNLSLFSDIMLLVISPFARTPYTSTHTFNHYSLLATIQDGLGVARTGNSTAATPLTDLFR